MAIASVGKPRVEFNLVDFYHELKRLIGVDSMKFSGSDIARKLDHLRSGFEQRRLRSSPVQTWPIATAVDAYKAVEAGGLRSKQVLLPHQ